MWIDWVCAAHPGGDHTRDLRPVHPRSGAASTLSRDAPERLLEVAGNHFGVVGGQRQVQQALEQAGRLEAHTRLRTVFNLALSPLAISRSDS